MTDKPRAAFAPASAGSPSVPSGPITGRGDDLGLHPLSTGTSKDIEHEFLRTRETLTSICHRLMCIFLFITANFCFKIYAALGASALTLIAASNCISSSALAGDESESFKSTNGEAFDKAFDKLEADWARLLVNGDKDKLAGLLATDFVDVDADGHLHDRTTYLSESASRAFHVDECAVESLSTRRNGDLAVVIATVALVGHRKNRDVSAFYRITDVFNLRDAQWQAFSRTETRISSRTDPLWERVGTPNGKSRIVLFVLGSFCPHCMTQLGTFAKEFTDRQYEVTVVSADTEDDLKRFPHVPFTLLADPEHKLFRRFGAIKDVPKHATVVIDGRGNIVFRTVGEKPFMDVVSIKRWIETAQAAEELKSNSDGE